MIKNITKLYGYLVIDGEFYSVDQSDSGQPKFVKLNRQKVLNKISRAKRMASKLKKSLDGEKVLTEALMINFSDKELDKLYKQLFRSKIHYAPKTREHHCVDMKVGNTIIPIVD